MDISGVYRQRIGTYRDVSGRIKVVKILRYASWSIGCVSHANRTRTRIGYVSHTEYVGNEPNLSNLAGKQFGYHAYDSHSAMFNRPSLSSNVKVTVRKIKEGRELNAVFFLEFFYLSLQNMKCKNCYSKI
jgi:hypothetical protein